MPGLKRARAQKYPDSIRRIDRIDPERRISSFPVLLHTPVLSRSPKAIAGKRDYSFRIGRESERNNVARGRDDVKNMIFFFFFYFFVFSRPPFFTRAPPRPEIREITVINLQPAVSGTHRRNLLMQIRRSYNARSRLMLIDDDRRRAICQFFIGRAVVIIRRLSDYRGRFSR